MDTTKLIEKAVSNFISTDKHFAGHCCEICGKLYKNQGSCTSHIEKFHPEYIKEEMKRLVDQDLENKIEGMHIYLFRRFDRSIQSLKIEIDKIREFIAPEVLYSKHAVERLFDFRRLEEWAMNTAKLEIMTVLNKNIDRATSLDEVISAIEFVINKLSETVIERFPTHNSTAELSNVYKRVEIEAYASMLNSRWGGGTLISLLKDAQELQRMIKEIE